MIVRSEDGGSHIAAELTPYEAGELLGHLEDDMEDIPEGYLHTERFAVMNTFTEFLRDAVRAADDGRSDAWITADHKP